MMSLFDEIINCADCPKIENTRDIDQKQFDNHLNSVHRGASGYAHIIAVANRCKAERDWIDATYEKAKNYLDDDFADNFLVDFNSRCWELCVYQYLIDNNITINIPSQKAGPDFDTSIGYIECVAVKRGFGPNAIPLMKASVLREDGTWSGDVGMQSVPTSEAQLRISNGMSEKLRKYQGYIDKGIIDPRKKRIIALNWYADGASFSATSSVINYHPVMRTLFAMEPTKVLLDEATGDVADTVISQQPIIPNANGTPIDMMYFMTPVIDDRDRIDGVIVSEKVPCIYRPDEFQLINNPFTNGFDIEELSVGKKIQATAHENGIAISEL